MPTYDYLCQSCGFSVDIFLPISHRDDPVNEACPACNHKTVKRLISAPTVVHSESVREPKSAQAALDKIHDINKNYNSSVKRRREIDGQ